MRVSITSDIHFTHFRRPMDAVDALQTAMSEDKPDIFVVAGDITQGVASGKEPAIDALLGSQTGAYFVLGNHDLWGRGDQKLDPPTAMDKYMKVYYNVGNPLEKSWGDKDTFYTIGDTAIVGSMGFPDFTHPNFKHRVKKLNSEGTTNDVSYMRILPLGWLHFTEPMNRAFLSRLDKAVESGAKKVVVVSHYAMFDGQCIVGYDEIAPYFFNHLPGQTLLEIARRHKDVEFWCLSGHSHEYSRDELKMESENVYVYGCAGGYGQAVLYTFDTELGMNQERKGRVVLDR